MFKIRSSKFRHVFCDQPKPEVGFPAICYLLLLLLLQCHWYTSGLMKLLLFLLHFRRGAIRLPVLSLPYCFLPCTIRWPPSIELHKKNIERNTRLASQLLLLEPDTGTAKPDKQFSNPFAFFNNLYFLAFFNNVRSMFFLVVRPRVSILLFFGSDSQFLSLRSKPHRKHGPTFV